MRDLIVTAAILGTIPFILRQPFVGLLAWIIVSILNPHRLTWGWAYNLPFAMLVAGCTMLSIMVHPKQRYAFPMNGVTVSMILFAAWFCVSPLFSFHPEGEYDLWVRACKIQFMVLLAFVVCGNQEQIKKLTWALALSVGFYGIKGGIFTIATGGSNRVWGPESSFISDNNHLALAVIMVVPLFRFLHLQAERKWLRNACMAAMILCTISALGSQSRGALLAVAAMAGFLWLKSRHKAVLGVLIIAAIPLIFVAMPESWMARMGTIKTYADDASAMGRINAWWMAWNLAIDRFPIGGGFAIYEPDVFFRYAPDPLDLHAAHSIYFQVLGEHGFIGLLLFLSIFVAAWRCGNWVIRSTKGRNDLLWAHDLAAMSQVSIVGYAVGGAFLSLSYFDLPYYIVAVLVILREIVRKELASAAKTGEPAPLAPTATAGRLLARGGT